VNAARRSAALRLVALVAVIFISFALFQGPVRHFEAVITAAVTDWLTGSQSFVVDSIIVVRPPSQVFFVALLTPSCSALAAAISLFVLGTTASRGRPRRRAFAVGAAVATVVAGNFLRLVGSLVAGSWAGRGALIGFHDTLGSFLTFVYILGGYVLMLWLLLPKERTRPQDPGTAADEEVGDHVLA
jgi:carbamoyl-phosphate synthase large subunit